MDVPVIEQAKIQAHVLVPLVKALQDELNDERANALVRKVLGNIYRRLGEQRCRSDSRTLSPHRSALALIEWEHL